MEYNEIEKEIRERWFPNHKAELKDYGDIKVLIWRNPERSEYNCRYVFDGGMLYISGDIGEAVFEFYSKISVRGFDDTDICYFRKKLRAFCDEEIDYDPEKAVARLKEWRLELIQERQEYDKTKMKELIRIAGGRDTVSSWAEVVNDEDWNEFISDLDQDYWEWIYKIGNAVPWRIVGYLVGLQMASEQLKQAEMDGD